MAGIVGWADFVRTGIVEQRTIGADCEACRARMFELEFQGVRRTTRMQWFTIGPLQGLKSLFISGGYVAVETATHKAAAHKAATHNAANPTTPRPTRPRPHGRDLQGLFGAEGAGGIYAGGADGGDGGGD